jgi:uncharacterized protein
MEREQLKRILAEQRENMLARKPGVRREALDIVKKKLKLPHVVMITGIRRSGKSTLLRQIISQYYPRGDFYYVDFEDERLFGFDPKDFNQIYEALLDLYGEKKTFFIDEIQRVKGFESFVRRFYADGFKFFITGSNTGLLSREFGTKLTGRHVDIAVRPFSFKEFLALRGADQHKGAHTTRARAKLRKLFDEYLRGGGMPEYAVSGDSEVLTRVYEDIVVKDIIARYDIQNERQLRELYRYMITNFSKAFSFNSLRKAVGLGSVETVSRYATYLEETHLGSIVSKFDYSLKKQIINDKKLYVVDNGFISAVSTKIGEGPGWFLENLVYNELTASGDVFYYAGKGECDFVVVDRGNAKAAVQVCYELTSENRSREINGLLEAIDALKLKKGVILTYDQEETIREDGTEIIVKPVWKWLQEDVLGLEILL